MSRRSTLVGSTALATVMGALLLRAVTVHSVPWAPLLYRATVNVNDLDGVEGFAPPGSFVELWYRQRNFIEGKEGAPDDPFTWCGWKNGGNAVRIGVTYADGAGVFKMSNLRAATTVMLFPPAANASGCNGGVYTELLPRVCDASGCSAWGAPTLNFLNVARDNSIAQSTGAVTGALQTALSIADGPDTGVAWGTQQDVDQNAIDTTLPGFAPGQRVSWRCAGGGTAVCPAVHVHDSSTIIAPDAEYPFVLATMQAHRHGGSFIAAAATPRNSPTGFHVILDVNVKFRGNLNFNLGCDQPLNFDFSRSLVY